MMTTSVMMMAVEEEEEEEVRVHFSSCKCGHGLISDRVIEKCTQPQTSRSL